MTRTSRRSRGWGALHTFNRRLDFMPDDDLRGLQGVLSAASSCRGSWSPACSTGWRPASGRPAPGRRRCGWCAWACGGSSSRSTTRAAPVRRTTDPGRWMSCRTDSGSPSRTEAGRCSKPRWRDSVIGAECRHSAPSVVRPRCPRLRHRAGRDGRMSSTAIWPSCCPSITTGTDCPSRIDLARSR